MITELKIREQASEPTEATEIHNIRLRYPSNWFAPVALSSFAHTIEEETIKWMDSLGLIPSEECLAHIRAMEPRHYAGYSHSMAGYNHALMYCKYITMWLLWDDDCVEVAEDFISVEPPLNALAGEYVESSDPYVAAFKHIGDEYERLGVSRQWRVRFANKMKHWAKNAIAEEVVRRKGEENQPNRELSEAVRLRAITVGIRPNSIPLEAAVGIELPREIYEDSDYEDLLEQAARICCIINDIVGVPKDIRNNQKKSNLVLYQQICSKSSLKDAYYDILNIHDQAVDRYDELAHRLLAKCDPSFRERLSTFFDHLRYMDSGFGYWHRDCVRYQEFVAIEGTTAFQVIVEER